MDREKQIIRQFLRALKPNIHSEDSFFETDAQAFKIAGNSLLFTTDEFSHEDHFNDQDPYSLGWNVTSATLSDILAAGGIPLKFGHSVTISRDWDDDYIGLFSQGIATCLGEAEVEFIGGDLGMSDSWYYTGIALGKTVRPLNRRGARAGDLVYMTGEVGNGNLQAALVLFSSQQNIRQLADKFKLKLPLRLPEAVIIRKYANCCTDSSDGIYQALRSLADLNTLGIEIKDPHYCEPGKVLCKTLNLPVSLLLIGECGEYELAFTISPKDEPALLTDAHAAGLSLTRIGRMTDKKVFHLIEEECVTDLSNFNIYARDYANTRDYLTEITKWMIEQKHNQP